MSPSGTITNIYKPSSAGKRIIIEVYDENGYVNDLSVSRKDYYQLEMEYGYIIGQDVDFEENRLVGVEVDDEKWEVFLD
jgi:hypothetical protein